MARSVTGAHHQTGIGECAGAKRCKREAGCKTMRRRSALDGPAAAWKCMMDVIEYHVPKLSRTEHTGADGGPIQVIASAHDERL